MLESGTLDIDHLRKILEFSFGTLQKLSSPAREEEMKVTYQKLLEELAEMCSAQDESTSSHALAMIKGLRFVLEHIQVCFMPFLILLPCSITIQAVLAITKFWSTLLLGS